MPNGLYENSAYQVTQATDIEKLVNDKREHWRASSSKPIKDKGDIRKELQSNCC